MLTLTADQIALFYAGAACKFGAKFAELTEAQRKGKSYSKATIKELQILGVMIERVYGYDPDDNTNCVESADMINMIEYIAVRLSICLTDLDAVAAALAKDGIDYMDVALGDNIQVVG